MKRVIKVLSAVLCMVVIQCGVALAAPSAAAYSEIINSLPAVGQSVGSLPSYAQALPPMGYGLPPQVVRGSYGGLEFVEVLSGGRVMQLQIKPEAGDTDTTSISGSIVSTLSAIYGSPITTEDGNYVWASWVTGSYSPRTGIISLQR